MRLEWLDLCIFETIEEVQQIATEWLWTYNHERPNMGSRDCSLMCARTTMSMCCLRLAGQPQNARNPRGLTCIA